MLKILIPARGNSQGVLNKNLRKLGDRSLVGRAIDLAMAVPLEKTVVLSTDSAEIAVDSFPKVDNSTFLNLPEGDILHISSGVYVHKRRQEHATSTSKTIETVLDVSKKLSFSLEDNILLLQPTSPYRSITELVDLLDSAKSSQCKSVISARKFDSPSPEKGFRVSQHYLIHDDTLAIHMSTPRQELREYYVSDGAYYLAQLRFLQDFEGFITDQTLVFVRTGLKTLNIDSEEDLILARLIFQNPDLIKDFM